MPFMPKAVKAAVDELMKESPGPANIIFPGMNADSHAQAETAISTPIVLPLLEVMSDEATFGKELARLFSPEGESSEKVSNHDKLKTLQNKLLKIRTASDHQLAGQLERPTHLLHALAAVTGGDAANADKVLDFLSHGLDISMPQEILSSDRALSRADEGGSEETGTRSENTPSKTTRQTTSPVTLTLLPMPEFGESLSEQLKNFLPPNEERPPEPIEASGDAAAHGAPAEFEPQILNLGWQTAMLLAGSGGGAYEALLAATNFSPADPADAKRRATALKVFLEGARSVCPQVDAAVGSTPVDLLRRANINSTVGLSMRAASKLWASSNSQDARLTQAEKTAYFNWKNNLREEGPDGNAALARYRLHKSMMWMERGRTRRGFQHLQRFFGRKKTPIAPLMRYGTLGAHLDTDEKESKKFDDAIKAAMTSLQTMTRAKLNSQPESEHASEHSGMQRSASLANAALTLARINTALAEQQESNVPPEAIRFNDNHATAIINEALAHLGESLNALQWINSKRKSLARQIAKERCTLENLIQWAEDSGFSETHQSTAFRESIRVAQKLNDNLSWKPADFTPDSLREFFSKLVQDIPMGNRMRHFDGARNGINNTIVPLSVAWPDVRARRSNAAVLEINTGGHAHELFFGKQKAVETHAGARGGINVGVEAVGISAGGNIGGDVTSYEGLRLRFLRRLDGEDNGTNAHREKNAAFISHYFDAFEKYQADGTDAHRLWDELIVNRYFDDEDFSVSWQQQRYVTTKVQTSIVAGGGPEVDGTLTAPGVTAGIEINPYLSLNRSERTGATPRTVVQVGNGGKPFIRAGFVVTPPGATAMNVVLAEANLAEWGKLVAIRAFEEGDRLSPNFVYKDIEYADVNTYKKEIRANAQQWEPLLSKEVLDAQLVQAEKLFKNNQRPAERWRMRKDAAKNIDALRSTIQLRKEAMKHLSDQSGVDALQAECEQYRRQIEAFFTDHQAWWEPVGSWNVEVNTREFAYGLNYWLQMTPYEMGTADRELYYVGTSTKVLNAKTNARSASAASSDMEKSEKRIRPQA